MFIATTRMALGPRAPQQCAFIQQTTVITLKWGYFRRFFFNVQKYYTESIIITIQKKKCFEIVSDAAVEVLFGRFCYLGVIRMLKVPSSLFSGIIKRNPFPISSSCKVMYFKTWLAVSYDFIVVTITKVLL